MKRLGVFCLLLVFSTAVTAEVVAPTIFGKINKEIRKADNKAKFKYATTSGVVDVQNSESRLGVQGAYKEDIFTGAYLFELGLHSTQAENDTGRIRIRRAFVTLGANKMGDILMGKEYPALELNGLQHDPLATTGAGAITLDQSTMVKNIASVGSGRTGMVYRGRANILGYRSPLLYGFQLYATADREHADGVQDTTTNYPAHAPTHYQYELTFDHKFDMGLSLKLTSGYRHVGGITVNEDDTWTYGLILSFMDFTLSGLYTDEDRISINNTVFMNKGYFPATHNKYTLLGLKYVLLKKNIFAATYSLRQADDGINRHISDRDNQKQIAFGYTRKLMDQVSVRLTYANLKKEYKYFQEQNDNGNNGQIYSFGTEVTF